MSAIEKFLGTPMAAPESPGMRRLRVAVITLSTSLAIGILMVGPLSALCGPVVTGATFALLILTTVVTGAVYFIRKSRRDDAWLDQLVADDRIA